MIERNMRRTVVKLLKPLHAISVENGLTHPGTPDVNCTLGWLELKAQNQWPARETTAVRLDHDLTPQQRLWLTKRKRAGGACWVLLTVDRTWLLLDGAVAAEHLGHVNRVDLESLAIRTWKGTPKGAELIECLQQTT